MSDHVHDWLTSFDIRVCRTCGEWDENPDWKHKAVSTAELTRGIEIKPDQLRRLRQRLLDFWKENE